MEIRRVIHDAHDGSVLCVAYNPDKRELITGGQDGAIKVWESDTGKPVRTLADGHLGWVTGLVYCEAYRLLLSVSIDTRLMVWDTRAKCEWQQRLRMDGQGHCVEWDGRRGLVYAGSNRAIYVYALQREHAEEPSRRRPILSLAHTIRGAHEDMVRSVLCSGSGKLFSAGFDASLCFYDVQDAVGGGLPTFAPRPQRGCHRGGISCVGLDWEHAQLVTGSFDKSVKVWAADGKLLQSLGPLPDTVTGVCYVPSTRNVWMASSSAAPVIYDLRTGANVTPFRLPASVRQLLAGSGGGGAPAGPRGEEAERGEGDPSERPSERLLRLFSLRGSGEVVGTTSSRALLIWKPSRSVASSVLCGHADWVEAVAYGRKLGAEEQADEPQVTLFSAGAEAAVRVWEPASRLDGTLYTQGGAPLAGHTGAVLCSAFCAEANALVTGSEDCTIRVWVQPSTVAALAAARDRYGRQPGGAQAGAARAEGHAAQGEPSAAAEAAGGASAAVPAAAAPPAAETATSALWSAATAAAAPPATEGAAGALWRAATARARARAAAADGGSSAGEGEEAAAAALAYIEASCAVLAGHEGRVTGLALLGPPAPPCSLVSVSADLSVRWWTLAPAGKQRRLLHAIERAHDDDINGVAYSPQLHQLATCSSDGGAKVWGAQSRTLVATLSGHTASVSHVAWSGAHGVWVTGSDDCSIRIWSALGRQLRAIETRASVSALGIDGHSGDILTAWDEPTHALRVFSTGLVHGGDEGEGAGEEDASPGAGGGGGAAAEADDSAVAEARMRRQRLRELAREPRQLRAYLGHTDCIRHIEHVPEKQHYVTASWDRTLRMWPQAGARREAGPAGALAGRQPPVRAATAGAPGARAASWRAAPAGGAGEAGGGLAEEPLSFADRHPLSVPKALQDEFGRLERRAGVLSLGADVSSRRHKPKPTGPSVSPAGQSGMALKLHDLLAEKDAALSAQLARARDKLASSQSTTRGRARLAPPPGAGQKSVKR